MEYIPQCIITLALLIALLYYCWNYITWLTIVLRSRSEIASPTAGGKSEKNVIRDGPRENLWKSGHVVANIGLNADRSNHISHIFVFPVAKAIAAGNVKSIWSVVAIIGIIPVVVLYFCDQHMHYRLRQIYWLNSLHSWLNYHPYRWVDCRILNPD